VVSPFKTHQLLPLFTTTPFG